MRLVSPSRSRGAGVIPGEYPEASIDSGSVNVVFCSDVSPSSEGVGWSVGCCGSCHEDEDLGYDTLWLDHWLHLCCSQMIKLERAGVDINDEQAVRAYVRAVAEVPA